MDLLLVLDDLRVEGLEFGLDEGVAGSSGGAVGAATGLGRVEVVIFELGDAFAAPATPPCQRLKLLSSR